LPRRSSPKASEGGLGIVVLQRSHPSVATDGCLQNHLMYYVYILELLDSKSKNFYIGYTADLKERMKQHLAGETRTTKGKNPRLIYYEGYSNKYLALKREKGIKTSGSVYMSLMKRLGLK